MCIAEKGTRQRTVVSVMISTNMHAVVEIKENITKTNMDVSRVRRCLFGRPDKDSLKADMVKMFAKDSMDAKERWNYDIVNDIPNCMKDGLLKWTPEPDAPSFYTRGYPTTKFRKPVSRVCNSRLYSKDYSDDSDDESCFRRLDVSLCSANSDDDCVEVSSQKLPTTEDLCNKSDSCEEVNSHSTTEPAKLVQTHMDGKCCRFTDSGGMVNDLRMFPRFILRYLDF